MPRKKDYLPLPSYLREPTKGSELLVEKAGELARYFFEDPYLVRGERAAYNAEKKQIWHRKDAPFKGDEMARTTMIMGAASTLEEAKLGGDSIGVNEAVNRLKMLGVDPNDEKQVRFAYYLADTCRQASNYLNVIKTKEKSGQEQWDAGLDLGQSCKKLFTKCVEEMEMKDDQVMNLFDAIFDQTQVMDAFAEMGEVRMINGMEAEVLAWLGLREQFGKDKVFFSSKDEDGKQKIDIKVSTDNRESRIQVKSRRTENGKVFYDVGNPSECFEYQRLYIDTIQDEQRRGEERGNMGFLETAVKTESKKTGKLVQGLIMLQPIREENKLKRIGRQRELKKKVR